MVFTMVVVVVVVVAERGRGKEVLHEEVGLAFVALFHLGWVVVGLIGVRYWLSWVLVLYG